MLSTQRVGCSMVMGPDGRDHPTVDNGCSVDVESLHDAVQADEA